MSNTGSSLNLPNGFSLHRLLRGHTNRITRIAWSFDGTRLATPSLDDTVRVWDAKTGKPVSELKGHENLVTGVSWSPDAKMLASSSDDRTARLWDVEAERLFLPPLKHPDSVTGVALSPDGKKLATSCDDNFARMWDAETGNLLKELKHADRVLSVAWSPDGSTLASASWDGTVRLWDGDKGEERLSPLSHRNKKVFCVTWSRDGRVLASGGFDSSVSVWDSSTGSRSALLEGHSASVLSVSFSSDGSLLASRSEDGTLLLWKTSTWESVSLNIPGSWPYSSLAFHPKEMFLSALGEGDRVVYVWRLDPEVIFQRHPPSRPADGAAEKIYVLHLSDIHLGTKDKATQYFVQLKTDINRRLDIERLNYLVVSGDITDRAAPTEFEAAAQLLTDIAKQFELPESQIILAPGNHDLSWDAAEKAYKFKFKRMFPSPPAEGDERYIRAGGVGWLERNESLYRKRFEAFAAFYERVCGAPYPLDFRKQGILLPFDEQRILFLTLNSSWNLDSYYTSRTGINAAALANALRGIGGEYDGWLKIGVWHHPVSGKETMDDAFLEQLAANEFQLVMHGHVHRPVSQIYEFDSRYGMRIIGAGTFGAPANQQVPGIPLQYNLLILDPAARSCTVHIGKKENPEGAWTAYGSYPIKLERWSRASPVRARRF